VYPDHMLPGDIGVYFDTKDIGLLVEPLRSRIYTIMEDCPDPVVPVSIRRSPWQQFILRRDRCPGREFDPGCQGRPTTALPYRSRHQRGEAADLGGWGLTWCITHRHEYGLILPVPGENWHFEASGAAPRRRILTYPGAGGPPAPTLPPEDDMDEGRLMQLIMGVVRPDMRLVSIRGDGFDEVWVTNGLDSARRVGPKYRQLLDDHFAVGAEVVLPLDHAAVLGNIIETSYRRDGRPLPAGFSPGKPATWPR
jgi:hypothetical protein